MARQSSPTLTDAEKRIMTVLWKKGEASVREITDALAEEHGIAYSSVLTIIRIMTNKGYTAFRKEGRAFIYRPVLTKDNAQKQALGSVVSSLFGGSPQRLAQHLVEDEKLTLEDIEALREQLLAKRREEGEA